MRDTNGNLIPARQGMIYVPGALVAAGQPGAGSRVVFVGNLIPANRINAVGKNAIAYYPLPNRAGRANNYVVNSPSSNSENQLILRAAGEGIYGVNAEGKTTFVNPVAERLLGWTAEELVGTDIHSTVHHTHHDGRHYPHTDCPIYAAFRDGAVHQVNDEVFWRKDGTPVWVEYTSTPIRDRGVVVGAVIVFRDVSQRREADEQLRAALAEVDQLRERLEQENAYLQEEIRTETNPRGIIGRTAAVQKTLRQVTLGDAVIDMGLVNATQSRQLRSGKARRHLARFRRKKPLTDLPDHGLGPVRQCLNTGHVDGATPSARTMYRRTGNLVATNHVQLARGASSSALPSAGASSPPGLDGRLLDQIHEPDRKSVV